MFDIGARIREIRKNNNMTMTELAKKVGLTQPQLSRIENNINMVQLDTLEKICEVFNMSLSEFFKDQNSNNVSLDDVVKELQNLTPSQLEAIKIVAKAFNERK
ncbi:Transcriptional regulator, contains XRE-family HTH domain [Caloranaerobacter azorensis DSM 13643]|uniref:Transcriptional regulator, contains XRE-family HTH domain n=1 Tax=Caloranaerobacter azorensis DSM 13643 TaxID=1121264 RepID=A0A1M5TU65_9FIRM|nr:helix-turn-helix transcriptional regulator [Caloranaerobacter azorensis]SHH54180.1 Transcriptional regulator, contains XRE-family HTH domain [Caloranaerobacter azorensis DSM 13643]